MKTLKENIKEKLVKKQQSKKEKINRLTEGFERTSFDFYNQNYDRFFKNMFMLAESLKRSKKFLNEDDSATFDSALLKSGLFSKNGEKLKEELVNYISRKIELTDEMKSKLKERIDSVNFEDIGDLFTNTDNLVNMIFDSVMDSLEDSIEEPTTILSVIKKNTVPYVRTADFERNAKKDIKLMVIPHMDNTREKFNNLVDRIKELLAQDKLES